MDTERETDTTEPEVYLLETVPADERAAEIGVEPQADLHMGDGEDIGVSPEAPVRQWRVAAGLLALREQVNALAPNRSRKSDGTIGDAVHATRKSDHNPWVVDRGIGVVTAMDLTHDPANGCDAGRIVESLRSGRDPRIKYIIWNRRIASSAAIGAAPPWAWRAYTGSNPHNHHCHISIHADKARFDAVGRWPLASVSPETLEDMGGSAAEDETLADIEAALLALPGTNDAAASQPPLIERLINAQDAIASLLSLYSRAVRGGIDMEEATRPTLAELREEYEALYASARPRAGSEGVIAFHRTRLERGRPRYEEVAAETGVPWWFIGILHAMEAGFNFAGHLHNGDPLTARTVNVPRGRPANWNPPSDWKSSAIDALRHDGLIGERDWSIAACLHRWEGFNGFGSRRRGINTPYLWSFTQHYTRGKFVRDGVFDPDAVSKQCGAATMLKALELAGTVRL